jgi:hypothetical protein
MFCGSLGLLIAAAALFGYTSSNQQRKLTPQQEAHNKEIEVNEWYSSTSQYSCEKNLKDKLREPESYVSDGDFSTPSDDGENKIITWKFRAKNGFGGYNAGIGMCYVGKENGGTIRTEIID